MNEQSCDFEYPDDERAELCTVHSSPEIDVNEVKRKALEFALSIMSMSRTAEAGRIRLEAARWLVCRHEHPENICKRLKCTLQRF
jgi:hypothetical protein